MVGRNNRAAGIDPGLQMFVPEDFSDTASEAVTDFDTCVFWLKCRSYTLTLTVRMEWWKCCGDFFFLLVAPFRFVAQHECIR